MNSDFVAVYNMKLAGWLMCHGYYLDHITPNRDDPRFHVFFFKPADGLKKAISDGVAYFAAQKKA